MESIYTFPSENSGIERRGEQLANVSCVDQFYIFLETVWEELRRIFSTLVNSISCCFRATKVADITPVETIFVDHVLLASGHTFDKVKLQVDDSPIPEELQEKIATLQQTMDDRKIPLTAWAPRPKQSYPVDQENAARYVDCLPPDLQETARLAISNTRHISMAEFNESLEICVEKLNHEMAEKKIKNYSVGMVYGKSNQWVTSLALKTLSQLPTSHFTLGSKQGTMGLEIHEQEFDMSHVRENSVVLFDDVSYSGTQMCQNIVKVAHEMIKRLTNDHEHINLFVVVPFISTAAFRLFNEVKIRNENKIAISLITMDERIQTTQDVFNESQYGLNRLCPRRGSSFREDTSCYTDWRLPDATSFWVGWGNETSIHKISKEQPNGGIETISEAFWCEGNNWEKIGKPKVESHLPWDPCPSVPCPSYTQSNNVDEKLLLHGQHLYQFIPQDIPRPYALKR